MTIYQTVALHDVVKPTRPKVKPAEHPGLPYIGLEHVEAHTTRLLRTVPAHTMKSAGVHFQPGDVLYSRLRPYLNKVILADFEGICSAEFIVLPANDCISGPFLKWLLNSLDFVQFANSLNAGDRPRVDFGQIGPYEFRLPPLDVQKQVVDEIETQLARLDDTVASLQRARTRLRRYRASVLKAACEGRLVTTEAELARQEGRDYEPASVLLDRIRAEREESHKPKIRKGKKTLPVDPSSLPELPDGWAWAKLGDLLSEPLRNGHSAKATQDGSGVPTISITAVTLGDFSSQNIKFTVADPTKVRNLWMRPGDIYIQRSNTSELVGTARLFQGSADLAIFPDLLIRVRLAPPLVPRYFEAFLHSHMARQYFRSKAQGIAGSMPKISQETIESLPVPIAPVDEQSRIVVELERISSIHNRIARSLEESLKRTEALQQSILRSAFNGQLVSDRRQQMAQSTFT